MSAHAVRGAHRGSGTVSVAPPAGAGPAAIDEIGKTAFMIACYRAQESRRANPIFHDPHAHLFVDDEVRAMAAELSHLLPAAQEMVRCRTRVIDDALAARIAAGTRQVLLLGAGFDARALRMAASGVRYFEIDRGAVLAHKGAVLAAAGLASGGTYVDCDYVEEEFCAALGKSGFEFGVPTHVIWEGNTAYLAMAQIEATLDRLAAALPDFSVSMDYLDEKVVLGTSGIPEIDAATNLMARLGSPWKTGLAGIFDLAAKIGLAVAEDRLTADVARQPGAGPSPIPAILSLYSVCTLAKGAAIPPGESSVDREGRSSGTLR